jgi:molybdenum cofactor synthesis domain-containing protein
MSPFVAVSAGALPLFAMPKIALAEDAKPKVAPETAVKRLYETLTDDQKKIVAQLLKWIANPEIDAVISTGGTGLTGRDVTPEAFRSVFEKEIEGFSAVFHRISYEKIGTSTVQSRACAGVGSPNASRNHVMTAGWKFIARRRNRSCALRPHLPMPSAYCVTACCLLPYNDENFFFPLQDED